MPIAPHSPAESHALVNGDVRKEDRIIPDAHLVAQADKGMQNDILPERDSCAQHDIRADRAALAQGDVRSQPRCRIHPSGRSPLRIEQLERAREGDPWVADSERRPAVWILLRPHQQRRRRGGERGRRPAF